MVQQTIPSQEILAGFKHLAKLNGWQDLHTPKNLAAAISVEAAELLAELQWLNEKEATPTTMAPDIRQRIGAEVADVVMYCLALCDTLGLDLATEIIDKQQNNQQRFGADASNNEKQK